MAGMSTSDVVAPSAQLARAQLAQAIAIKQQMAEGRCAEQAVEVAQVMIWCLRSGGKVIFFGNGGSAQDAGHLAAELMGRFAFDRPGLAAFSLPDATAAMTAIGNDYSFEDVFARQVEGLGAAGDIAFGISTSGNSKNVLRAMEVAARKRMTTVGLSGRGGKLAAICDHCICIPSEQTPRIQEAQILTGHILCEIVERQLFSDEKA